MNRLKVKDELFFVFYFFHRDKRVSKVPLSSSLPPQTTKSPPERKKKNIFFLLVNCSALCRTHFITKRFFCVYPVKVSLDSKEMVTNAVLV